MDEVTRKITYQGTGVSLRQLVQMLEEEGTELDSIDRPHLILTDSPGGVGKSFLVHVLNDLNEVMVTLVATGTALGIKTAVEKYRKQHPQAKVSIREDREPSADPGESGDAPVS